MADKSLSSSYDVVVIGSGPGGYVAAVRAAHNGLRVAIVEKDKKLGGTCLLRGCIPTKSLLHSADVLQEMQGAAAHGITCTAVGFDFAKVQKARAKVVTKSAAGVSYLMKSNKIEVHQGLGALRSTDVVEVKDSSGKVTAVLQAKNIILASGSVPRRLPFIEIDGKHFVTSDEILELKQPPKSLIVLGAGAVGVEFASIYSRFGTECTIIEMLDRALPIEDEDVSKEFAKALSKRKINLQLQTTVKAAQVKGDGVEVVVSDKDGQESTLTAEMCLVAIGRAPVTDNLNLKAVGISTERGFIAVDGLMRTAVPTIFAIGDIVQTPQLAHIASAEALVAADVAAGKDPQPLNYLETPSCTYADPEVASVGLTEHAAVAKGYTIKVGTFPFAAVGKARILGKTEGFVKIVADVKYDEILGVHIIGPRATDLIAEACVAIRAECTTEELAHTIHAHPTLPEAMLEAAHGVMGRPIHL